MNKYKFQDLQKLCRENNLKTTGKKEDLFQLLVDNNILQSTVNNEKKNQFTVPNLKKICKDNNLKTTGTKSQLLERLKENGLLPEDCIIEKKDKSISLGLQDLQYLCEENNLNKLGSRDKLLKRLQENNIELKKKKLSPIEEMAKKYSVSELKKICKEKNLKATGKKEDLAKRIVNEKIFFIKDDFYVTPLKDELFLHKDTQFIYNMDKNLIIGKWNDNKVMDLTKNDILLCKEMKLPYLIPIILTGEMIKKQRKKEDLLDDDDDDEDLD